MRIENLKATADEKALNKLLGKWLPEERFVILVECWTFPKLEEFWGCCGEHTELIKTTMRSQAWLHVKQDLRGQLEALWKHKDKILVACADGQGTHRSVSVAAALKQLCLKKGLLSKGPYHLCRDNWQKRKVCSSCKHCKLNNEKEDMYDQLQQESLW